MNWCDYGCQMSDVQMTIQYVTIQEYGSSVLTDNSIGATEQNVFHNNIHSGCRTTSVPNQVTVASRTTKIWPNEFCEILTFSEI